MTEYLLLMHTDIVRDERADDWESYFKKLEQWGVLKGGSEIGSGVCCRKEGDAGALSSHLNGFIKIEVSDIEAAKACLEGNPVYEAGGTIEIRALPQTG